jgi:hypothetical protein
MFEIILIGLTIVGIYLIIISAKSPENSFLDRFSSKLNALIFLYLALGVFLNYDLGKNSLKKNEQDATLKIIEKSWLGTNNMISEEYKNCPELCDSLYFDWQKKEMNWKSQESYEGKDEWYSVLKISVHIFQSFEDVLTVSDLDQTGMYVWVANFIQWCHSPHLRKSWNVLKPNFASKTREFGDYLFEYISSNPAPQNITELTNISIQLAESNEIKNLIKKA